MIGNARLSLAAALVLLAASVAPAAAQRGECSAEDGARVGWIPAAGFTDETWPGVLVATGVVTAETKLVRIPDGREPRLANREELRPLLRDMARGFRDRAGDQRLEAMVLLRIEPDGTVSRSLVARSSGILEYDEAAREASLRMRFSPTTVDGCRIAVLAPLPMTVQNSATPR